MTFVMQCSCISQTNEGSTVCLSKLLYQHSHVFPSWKLFSLQFQPVESCGVLLSKAPYPMQYRQNCWSNLSLASARHVHNAPCSTWRCIPWSVRSLGKLSGIKGGSYRGPLMVHLKLTASLYIHFCIYMEQHMDQYDQSYLKWKLDILNRYSRMWAMEKEHQYIDQLFILFLETIIYSHSYWYDRTEPLKSEVTAHNRRGRLLQHESASFGHNQCQEKHTPWI